MNIRHKELDIPEDNPFQNDKLDREKYAAILTNIVKNYANGFVMSINNPWGEGKTTFIKMWKKYLEDDLYSTLYFNAWESDFEDEALVSLISQLSDLNKNNKHEKNFKKIIKDSAPLLVKMPKIILKGLSDKYLGEGVASDISNVIMETTETTMQRELEVYAMKQTSRDDFKKSLQKYVSEVSNSKPVVFFIDELDRCKPSYAVKVLEQIKHLFSVEGIIFVLSIDKTQLGNSVRGFFGSDQIDADEYLKRFIDIEFSFPKVSNTKFCDYLYQYYDFKDFFDSEERKRLVCRNDKYELLNLSRNIVSRFRINLRSIDKLFSHLKIILSSFSHTEPVFPDLIMFLLYLKSYKKDIYVEIAELRLEPFKLSKLVLDDLLLDDEKTLSTDTLEINIARLILFYSNSYKNRIKGDYRTDIFMEEIEEYNLKIYSYMEQFKSSKSLTDSLLASLEINNFTERIDLSNDLISNK